MKLNLVLFNSVVLAVISIPIVTLFPIAKASSIEGIHLISDRTSHSRSVHISGPRSSNLLSQTVEAAPKAEFQDKLRGTQLLNALRKGGYVIFFRHGQTEVDYADQIFARMGHCVTQRVLSEKGWQQAKQIGQAFQQLKIPVGNVYSSEYCRAWQTADLAFGRYKKMAGLNFAPAEDYTPEQITQMRDGIKPFLIAVPESGTNTVLVGHDDVFEAATEIYPEPQGIAFILKPDGVGKFEIVANLQAEEWLQLAR